jgi:PDZ domain-containing secreted protein
MSRQLSALAVLMLIASMSAAAQQQATMARAVVPPASPRGGLATIAKGKPGALTTIQGNALNSTNGHLSNVAVRLRDARFGRIVSSELTDKTGMFAFKAVDPGSYIIEMMANDNTVLAASQMLHVNAGEAVSAVVKLPFRVPPFASLMGTASTPSAAAVAVEAAATGIAAAVPTTPISPNQ